MKKIRVRLKKRSYSVFIAPHLLARSGSIIKKLSPGTDAVVITNRRLLRLFGKNLSSALKRKSFSVRFFLTPDSEKAKSEKEASRLLGEISAYDKGRSLFIIALGGGVVGDLAGFVASIYKRGVPYVQIPTTLLAQVDSGIGGKVAIDLPAAKNLVGAFYQPRAVISDVSLLKKLPKRQIRSGLAEIIKYGVIKDAILFAYLEKYCGKILKCDRSALEYVAVRASAIKAGLVEKDEFDKRGIRAILNYGHTVGHAIEAASEYSKQYTHGEAIAVGMIIANEISLSLGRMLKTDALRIIRLIRAAGLPTVIRKGISLKKIYEAYLCDKKFEGPVHRLILPTRIGRVSVVEGVRGDLVKTILRQHHAS